MNTDYIISQSINGNWSEFYKHLRKMTKKELVQFILNWHEITGENYEKILEDIHKAF